MPRVLQKVPVMGYIFPAMTAPALLSIVIPALDAAGRLDACLSALDEGREAGLLLEIIVADGGSADATAEKATARGARCISAQRGRGTQLAAGADAASGEWLLFLHADTVLAEGWARSAACFMEDPGNARRAAYFRFALDDGSAAAARLESLVASRCRVLALPYGDQGLLMRRDFYRQLGGFKAWPLMEDVDLVRRIVRRRGRGGLQALDVAALTSAERYRGRHGGYLRRSLRNLVCLGLYFLRVPPRLIERIYA